MKVSWRNPGEDNGTFEHSRSFGMGEKYEGKGPRDFMIYLIRETQALEIALNDNPIWSISMIPYPNNVEEFIIHTMMGQPREASILITVDYNSDGDWIDNECAGCGGLFGTHLHCPTLLGVDKGWLDMEIVNDK